MVTQGPAGFSYVPLLSLPPFFPCPSTQTYEYMHKWQHLMAWMGTGIIRPHACWIINGSREPHWPSPSWMCCMWISTQFWNIRWFFGLRRERISSIESWRTFTSYALRSASDKLCNRQQLKCNNVNCKQGNYMYIHYINEHWKCTSSTTIKFTQRKMCSQKFLTQGAITISSVYRCEQMENSDNMLLLPMMINVANSKAPQIFPSHSLSPVKIINTDNPGHD